MPQLVTGECTFPVLAGFATTVDDYLSVEFAVMAFTSMIICQLCCVSSKGSMVIASGRGKITNSGFTVEIRLVFRVCESHYDEYHFHV